MFGVLALTAVRRPDVRAWVLALVQERHLAGATVRLALATLRALFSAAVDAELLEDNPARGLGRQVGRQPRLVHDILRPAEREHLLATAAVVQPQLYPLYLTLARTGVRPGEGLALQWDDLHLAERRHDPAHLVPRPHRHAEDGRGPRGRSQPTAHGRARGAAPARTVVFPAPLGVPYSNNRLRDALRWVARRAGLPGRYHRHGFRHAYASELLAAGVPLQYVQRQLGHHDPKLTARLYGEHLPMRNLAAVDALDGGWPPAALASREEHRPPPAEPREIWL